MNNNFKGIGMELPTDLLHPSSDEETRTILDLDANRNEQITNNNNNNTSNNQAILSSPEIQNPGTAELNRWMEPEIVPPPFTPIYADVPEQKIVRVANVSWKERALQMERGWFPIFQL